MKRNEGNWYKLNKYQSRISSTFSARLPLIFIHRANWLSLIKQHAIAEDQQISCSIRDEGGCLIFPREEKSVWRGWLKITTTMISVRAWEKEEELEESRFPTVPRRFESRWRVNRRGILVRGWFQARRWSLLEARPWLHVSRRKRNVYERSPIRQSL